MPKNIVLLSDGTGNSSAQLLKTNVWRVYEALNLTDPSVQVACYDDGVGTSSLRPIALLGGMFGVGLRRNVMRLYRFLCEHYDPGDQIFLFGFSRGAFTVRVLAGLITRQGIIKTRPTLPVAGATVMAPQGDAVADKTGGQSTKFDDPPATGNFVYAGELARLASWAYRDFRKAFNQTGRLVTVGRWLRDAAFRSWDVVRGRGAYTPALNHQNAHIAFIGVWDTVDAYGLAVDELTDGVDRWVWPLSMPDLTLHENVKRACHVLALDDERNTFHPVLWDESSEPLKGHIKDERITQVWFAGMHSNVGGGYPDDALSAVSLKWMTDQVKDQLQFVPELLIHHTAKADPLGRLYDSRGGAKGYYRYNPRRIEWLTNGQKHERAFFDHRWPKPLSPVTIIRPKIHESVFTRMAAAPEAYAPIVLPEKYAVLMEDGRILDGDENPYEAPNAAKRRVAAQEAVWDLVWWRRTVYFAVVALTVFLVVRPFTNGANVSEVNERVGTANRVVLAAGEWLPSYASPWIGYFSARPWELFIGLAALLLLSRRGRALHGKICSRMRSIWLEVLPPAINRHYRLPQHQSALKAVRSSNGYQGVFAVVRRVILPNVAGIFILVWVVAFANRVIFEAINSTGRWCPDEKPDSETSAPGPVGENTVHPLQFDSNAFCHATGVVLEAGREYQIRFAITGQPWTDGGVGVVYSAKGFNSATPGLTKPQRAIFWAFTPFRRLWSADWFVPIARIGRRGLDQYRLDAETMNITAKTTGELFLFVNDAIVPVNVRGFGLGWDEYYKNNQGTATITVSRLRHVP